MKQSMNETPAQVPLFRRKAKSKTVLRIHALRAERILLQGKVPFVEEGFLRPNRTISLKMRLISPLDAPRKIFSVIIRTCTWIIDRVSHKVREIRHIFHRELIYEQ